MTPSRIKLLADLRSGAVLAGVKLLVWVDRHDNPIRANDLIASSIIGQYGIRPSADGASFRLFIPGRLYNDAEVFGGVDLAKAAAQADYEARILSALSPSPDLASLAEMIEGLVGEIEAPKDGSHVLAWCHNQSAWIVVCWWAGSRCWARPEGGDEVFPSVFRALPPAIRSRALAKDHPNGG